VSAGRAEWQKTALNSRLIVGDCYLIGAFQREPMRDRVRALASPPTAAHRTGARYFLPLVVRSCFYRNVPFDAPPPVKTPSFARQIFGASGVPTTQKGSVDIEE
jgi:hypothetical protein